MILMNPIQIGIISDTHNLLRPEARIAFRDVDHIIHAGDICDERVLQELREIAPVSAVRGNNDRCSWARQLSEKITLDIAGVKIHVIHDMQDLNDDLIVAGVKVVITGHSHRPAIHRERGILYINPGSAGPRRFRLPVSVGFLEISDGLPKARLQTLEVD